MACGVAAGAAVLTGALLVGDSMRESLRRLTLDRLGRIDQVLVAERFFRAELAAELAADPRFKDHFCDAIPAILVRTSIQQQTASGSGSLAPRVNLISSDERFWRLWPGEPDNFPEGDQIVLNLPLARKLNVEIGDTVMLRLPRVGTVPADSLLGRTPESVRGIPLQVGRIIPAEGPGRFSLRPNQQLPLNAYVSLKLGMRLFRQPGQRRSDRVNAIIVASEQVDDQSSAENEELPQSLLRPSLEDLGISVAEQPDHGYVNVTSDRMILSPAVEAAMLEALQGENVQPALTYLANTIARGQREIPYSMITAVDLSGQPPLGPFLRPDGTPIGPLAEGRIVLNDWAAEDLGVKPGDEKVSVSYFDPETSHGLPEEKTTTFELAAIVRLSGPAFDPAFTPAVTGVTDTDSINDWDPPFQPFHRDRVRSPDEPGPGNDEDYWNNYTTTPKAFVSLAEGRKLWGSRFGKTTSLRVVPAEGESVEKIRNRLEERLAAASAGIGFVFRPVKQQGLVASKGTTSFAELFVAFSFFIIGAAMMLVALLFRLGIDARAEQIGILLAVGLSRRRISLLLAGEGLVVAALGSLVGIVVGVAYAALMLVGLTSEQWWLKAVGTPFLRLYLTPGTTLSLAIGYASSLFVALAAVGWAIWRSRRTPARQLLAGQAGEDTIRLGGRSRFARWMALIALLGAVVLALFAALMDDQARAGAFFGAGALTLTGALALTWTRLRAGSLGPAVAVGRGNLLRMSVRNLARNPGRSALTIGLVASASFLVISVSAFHADPSRQAPHRESGNGGFTLVAESDQPIYHDLGTPEGRAQSGFSADASEALEKAQTFSVRVKPGDDASCLNLYKPQQPRILGMPDELINRGGFTIAPWERLEEAEINNPWLLLKRDLGKDADGVPLLPALLDAATATYSLHLGKGNPSLDVVDGDNQPLRLKIVGVLPGSIFQGDLLIDEESLLRHFSEVGGYQFFLVETPPEETKNIQASLDKTLQDYGLASETTGSRLARFLVVQNTYLQTFQSLGGLGLLLGTFGLAAVQLRNVLERRRELALLRATGLRNRLLATLIMLENGLLLIAGLACGVLAALVAVLPHLVSGSASIPWTSLGGTLLLVLAVGLFAGLAAARATLSAPLLAALRGE